MGAFEEKGGSDKKLSLADLQKKEIVIYGNGHVGHKFLRVLREQGLEDRVRCFAVSKPVETGTLTEGIPVFCIHDIAIHRETLVCLAVHEALREEMEQILKGVTDQFIWIHPYLYSLMLGEAEQKNVEVATGKILRGCKGDARLAVRLAAIEQQEGKNQFGFDYYKRAQMLHCTAYTAELRLQSFRKLIVDWGERGYQSMYPLSLNQRFELIDGNHRLALGVYHRQKSFFCDIYPTRMSAEEIHGEEAVMTEQMLRRQGFVEDEINRLKQIQERYLGWKSV